MAEFNSLVFKNNIWNPYFFWIHQYLPYVVIRGRIPAKIRIIPFLYTGFKKKKNAETCAEAWLELLFLLRFAVYLISPPWELTKYAKAGNVLFSILHEIFMLSI